MYAGSICFRSNEFRPVVVSALTADIVAFLTPGYVPLAAGSPPVVAERLRCTTSYSPSCHPLVTKTDKLFWRVAPQAASVKIDITSGHFAVLLRVFWPTFGVWLSLVERCVRDAEVVSSNLATPT